MKTLSTNAAASGKDYETAYKSIWESVRKGKDVAKDRDRLAKSLPQWKVSAYRNLGQCYKNGLGTAVDKVNAKSMFDLAAIHDSNA